MTTDQLISHIETLGCRLIALGGERLRVTNPDRLPQDVLESLRQRKSEILGVIRSCPGWGTTPPDDLPLNPIFPRPLRASRELVIAHILRQGGRNPTSVGEWLVKRENDYFVGPGRHWDCGLLAYAAARDCAQWQHRSESERELLERLSAFNEARPWDANK